MPPNPFERVKCFDVHDTLSQNYPTLPATFSLRLAPNGPTVVLEMRIDGALCLSDGDDAAMFGTWFPLSSRCMTVEVFEEGRRYVFEKLGRSSWISYTAGATSTLLFETNAKTAAKKGGAVSKRALSADSTPCVANGMITKSSNSRTRTAVLDLPPDSLEVQHKDLLRAMGLRLARHPVCGRILVADRYFDGGDTIIHSKVSRYFGHELTAFDALQQPGHPKDALVLVPQEQNGSAFLYYNRSTFSWQDPIGSGDIWYLVNHSTNANTRLHASTAGLSFKALRKILRGEPITWRYPIEYFTSDDQIIDLPRFINVHA